MPTTNKTPTKESFKITKVITRLDAIERKQLVEDELEISDRSLINWLGSPESIFKISLSNKKSIRDFVNDKLEQNYSLNQLFKPMN